MTKENSYEKSAKKKSILKSLGQGLDTKHNAKNSLLESGKDLIIGVIGGGLAGAAIGKPSLVVGLGVAGLGHYLDCQPAKLLGIGLMAANGFQDNSLDGLKGLNGVKERLEAYKKNFAEKLYITEIKHKKKEKKEDKAVNGAGEVQYFNYPQDLEEMKRIHKDMDDEELAYEHLYKQIETSGDSHIKRNNINMDDVETATALEDEEAERQNPPSGRERDRERGKEPNNEENEQGDILTRSPSENII